MKKRKERRKLIITAVVAVLIFAVIILGAFLLEGSGRDPIADGMNEAPPAATAAPPSTETDLIPQDLIDQIRDAEENS